MNIFRLALELFVIYLIYKFIFELVIPVYKASRRMKDEMGKMQEKMKQHDQNMRTSHEPSVSTPPKEDYIDYEEIK